LQYSLFSVINATVLCIGPYSSGYTLESESSRVESVIVCCSDHALVMYACVID